MISFAGGRDDPINEEGLQYYSDVVSPSLPPPLHPQLTPPPQIDECLRNGITPFVTIHHFDLPLALEKRYGGWVHGGAEIVQDFVRYAGVLFERFGDRVKHWITINEPHIYSLLAVTGWMEGFQYEKDAYM